MPHAGSILGEIVHQDGEVHVHLKMGGGTTAHPGTDSPPDGLSYEAGEDRRTIYMNTMRVRMYMCRHVPVQQDNPAWMVAPGEMCQCPWSDGTMHVDGMQMNYESCRFFKWSNGMMPDNHL